MDGWMACRPRCADHEKRFDLICCELASFF
jgi:hypothetical protein